MSCRNSSNLLISSEEYPTTEIHVFPGISHLAESNPVSVGRSKLTITFCFPDSVTICECTISVSSGNVIYGYIIQTNSLIYPFPQNQLPDYHKYLLVLYLPWYRFPFRSARSYIPLPCLLHSPQSNTHGLLLYDI